MMDELELLKKDWQQRDATAPKLTYDEIYKMLWKKSSSVVKWIFLISLIEFILPHLLYLVPSLREGTEIYANLGIKNAMLGLTIFQYAIAFYFIYEFYKRYKEISALDNAKNLMFRIIKTRKTVKKYVIISLSVFFFTFIVFAIGVYMTDDISSVMNTENIRDFSEGRLKLIFGTVIIAAGIIITCIMGLIYFLLYGFLLRKLGRNYSELKRLEV